MTFMRAGSASVVWRLARAACGTPVAIVALVVLVAMSRGATIDAQDEVRALWVVRSSLTSPAAVETMVSDAAANGFNTLLVQVRGRGDAYYRHGLEPRPSALEALPDFDPLAMTIARAHGAKLQVHAWVNVNLVASASQLPTSREHVIYRHPEWLMVPRALAGELTTLDPRAAEYLDTIARYLRSRSEDIEGLYLSPITSEAAAYTVKIVRDIAERYDVDGIHLDYIRYPSDDFDYSHEALSAFRRSVDPDLAPSERQRYEARLTAEPLIYTDAFPERWRSFRTARLTALVENLSRAVKAARPTATVSAAVQPNARVAAARRSQDWVEWLRRGAVDVVCPMVYTTDASQFAAQLALAREGAGAHPLWAGIGAYQLSVGQIADNIQTARRAGAHGIALFSYDSLIDPSRGLGSFARLDFWK
jgi:uncharacterized lipoprotein YddW (UPF0748 family)